MDQESVSAVSADPEEITSAIGADDIEGQVIDQTAEGDEPEEKKASKTQSRRDRDKAYRATLQTQAAEAMAKAEAAEARRKAILDAGKSEAPPNENDYPDPIEFAAAKAIWGAEQKHGQREAKQAGEAVEAAKREAAEITGREQVAIDDAWRAQMADAQQRYADFDAVALSREVPISKDMGELIKTSDVGADVAYFLGQNRPLAAQIASMSVVEAARAIGRIEAGLQRQKPRTETNAPNPINPVRGSGGATRDPASMSMQDWIDARKSGKIK